MKIKFRELSFSEIDIIKPLWEKLNEHHIQCSEFRENFKQFTFAARKKRLKDKQLKVLVAYHDKLLIGYCISSIIEYETEGEIESIFIENEFRNQGIGREFMERSVNWFKEKGIGDIKIQVAAGNEDALDFYNKFGFKTCTYKLRIVP